MSASPAHTLTPDQTQEQQDPSRPETSPPLHSGDHLSSAEFEKRYAAHPEIKKAELIEGVVYVSSPVRLRPHGVPHARIMAWLGYYWSTLPALELADNATLRLDNENEVQPDALLRLPAEKGGRSRITEDEYLAGAPELVVEVAASSAAIDAHTKKRVYARNGVQEYLLVLVHEEAIAWFALREGVYAALTADEAGVLKSEIFPGLWLKPEAFWRGDLAQVLAVLQEGIASEEHQAFSGRLQPS